MSLNPSVRGIPTPMLKTSVLKTSEVVLSSIEGSSARERIHVVLCNDSAKGSRVELRQQSWGDGVGWFTQSTVTLAPHQVAELRGALGNGVPRSSRAAQSGPRRSPVSIPVTSHLLRAQ